ncbi:MAG: hypothetical protein PVG25_08230 [Anaerolineae bacterium]|jgi:hypothetical protein
MEGFLVTESLIALLIVVATLVAIVARRVRLLYTACLVLVGLFLAAQRAWAVEIESTLELILAILVHPSSSYTQFG